MPPNALRVVAAGARRDCRSALKAAAFAAPYDGSRVEIRDRHLRGATYLIIDGRSVLATKAHSGEPAVGAQYKLVRQLHAIDAS